MPIPCFMNLEGESQGKIEGSSQITGREGAILVQAVDHTIEIPKSPQTGLPTGKRVHLPMTVTKEIDKSSLLMQKMLWFSQALITQMAQVSVCNCHHSLEQRLCRWILVYADRADESPMLCTQEQLAQTLGVRRERLAKAARTLQKNGLIQYVRGAIELIHREGIEQHACECYGLIQLAYARMEAAGE